MKDFIINAFSISAGLVLWLASFVVTIPELIVAMPEREDVKKAIMNDVYIELPKGSENAGIGYQG